MWRSATSGAHGFTVLHADLPRQLLGRHLAVAVHQDDRAAACASSSMTSVLTTWCSSRPARATTRRAALLLVAVLVLGEREAVLAQGVHRRCRGRGHGAGVLDVERDGHGRNHGRRPVVQRGAARWNSRKSHALASRHSRLTVRAETPVTWATSSTDSPAKNRSSTIQGLVGVMPGQPFQGPIDRQHVRLRRARRRRVGDQRTQRHGDGGAAALGGVAGPGVITENPPHHSCRCGEELRPVVPRGVLLIDQLHEQGVDQIGGVEVVSVALLAQLT